MNDANDTTHSDFPLFRYFLIISFLTFAAVLVLAGLGAGRIFQYFGVAEAERRSTVIADYLRDNELAPLLGQDGRLHALDGETFLRFDERMRHVLEAMDIAKIKIYSPDTTIVYSTDHAVIGMEDPDNEDLEKALAGQVVSELKHKDDIWDLKGEEKVFDVDIVETYVPARDAQGRIFGSFEVYSNISPLFSLEKALVRHIYGLLGAIVLIAFLALAFLMRRATSLIARQNSRVRRANGALRESETRFKDIAENLREWIWEIDAQGRFTYASPKVEALLGYTTDEIVKDKRFCDICQTDGGRTCDAQFEDIFKSRKPFEGVLRRVLRKDGSGAWFLTSGVPILDAQGDLLGYRGCDSDISLRKKAEEDREKVIAELKEALTQVKTLSGLLPLCASCKKVRDDKGYWNQIDEYISTHSEAEISHSICPQCAKKLYPEDYQAIYPE